VSLYPTQWPTHYPRAVYLGAGMMALCLDGTATALDVAVDRPGDWWNPQASHHGLHAAGGAVIGALGYEGAALLTDQRDRRVACATALGLAAGAAYELAAAGGLCSDQHGEPIADPVDALWVGIGAFVGATVAAATNDVVSVALSPRGASIIVAMHF
jgi:hypothetical protein